jgi:hypothetical protein
MKVLYIAGPMTGHPDFNYPAFHAAEAQLHDRGYSVLNPARRGIRPDWRYDDYLRRAIADVLAADGLALLPGWLASRGARTERDIATAIGLDVGTVADWLTIDQEETA